MVSSHLPPLTSCPQHRSNGNSEVRRSEAFRRRDGALVNELSWLVTGQCPLPSGRHALLLFLSWDNAAGRPSPHTTLWSQTFQPQGPGEKKQLSEGVGSLLPQCGFWGLNSGLLAWQQTPFSSSQISVLYTLSSAGCSVTGVKHGPRHSPAPQASP